MVLVSIKYESAIRQKGVVFLIMKRSGTEHWQAE